MSEFVPINNYNTALQADVLSSDTTIQVASTVGLPTLGADQKMELTLNDAATGLVDEIVYVTAIAGSVLTVERGREGTSARNWTIGDAVYCALTAGTTAMATGNPLNKFAVANGAGANDAVALGQFVQTFESPGRIVFPPDPVTGDSTIMQWGSASVGRNPGTFVTFPVSFPNACLKVIPGLGNLGGTGANTQSVGSANPTASGFTGTFMDSGAGTFGTLNYIAVGH